MLQAKEALELAKLENLSVTVGKRCDKALDDAVIAAIEAGRNKVDIALGYRDCSENDATIAAYLKQHGYKNISVTHDYPGYNESYQGATYIKFTF